MAGAIDCWNSIGLLTKSGRACTPRLFARSSSGSASIFMDFSLCDSYFIAATATIKKSEDSEPSFLEGVQIYFQRAAAKTTIAPSALAHINAVDVVLRVTFPIQVPSMLQPKISIEGVLSDERWLLSTDYWLSCTP